MREESLSGLAEITGMDRRTVKDRVSSLTPRVQGKKHLYDTSRALPLIYCSYGAGGSPDKAIDYQEERARLTHHQANIAELDEEERRGSLVKVDDVVDLWASAISNTKTKLLSLPNKITHQLLAADDHKAALAIFKEQVNEALEELASGNIGPTSGSADKAMDPSAEFDRQSVG